MSTQRAQKFDTVQNWENQKIRGIIYLERGNVSAGDGSAC